MDDSCGVGLLGKTGKGTCEHFGFSVRDIDIFTANLDTSVCSVGGFCAGNRDIIYHQRLNGSGYVYSASLPPLLTCAGKAGFDVIERSPELITQLANKLEVAVKELSNIGGIKIRSTLPSPVIHIELEKSSGDRLNDEETLQSVVDEAFENGVLLTRSKYVNAEAFMPTPSIRISVSIAIPDEDLKGAISVVKRAVDKTLQNLSTKSENSNNSEVRKRNV